MKTVCRQKSRKEGCWKYGENDEKYVHQNKPENGNVGYIIGN